MIKELYDVRVEERFTKLIFKLNKKACQRSPVGAKMWNSHIFFCIQTHLIIGYHSTQAFLHLEDFRDSDVEFYLELEFN